MGLKMNVYDFDGTIYKKDSSVEFYKYTVRVKPWLLLQYLPKQIFAIIKYKLSLVTKEEMKETYFSFLKGITASRILDDFTDHELPNINEWYLEQRSADDIIISASPEFLVRAFARKLGVTNVIASKVDISTGAYSGKNCHGKEKVIRLYQEFPEAVIDKFYSDTASDIYLAQRAKHAFMVNKNKISEWEVFENERND